MNIQKSVIAFSVFASTCVHLAAAQQASPPAQTPTIVTLGDSITKGVRSGVANAETFSAIIQTMLQEDGAGCQVVNKGLGGERTDQALKRLDDIIRLKPRLVTVMYGTNDSYVDPGQTVSRISVSEYRDNLREIVRRLREANIQPVLMTEPRWAATAQLNGIGEHPNVRLETFVEACRNVANQQNVPLVDHFDHWTQAEAAGETLQDWTTDACHPNPHGHRTIADLMQPVLRTRLTSGTPAAAQNLATGNAPVTVVCFGDSVTGLYYHTGGRRAYTDLLKLALQRRYPHADVSTINAGISGNTTRDGLARIEKDVLAKNPSVVTVMFGLNDMTRIPLEEYRSNLLIIVDKVRGSGAEVVLCTPNSVITTPSRPVEKLEQYCDVVREIASDQNVSLCDCYAAYQSLREQDAQAWRLLMSDEIHPNCNGHKRIAEQLAQTMTGRAVSLADVASLRPAIPHSFAKLRAGEAIRVLAMPPFDQSIAATLNEVVAEASVEVISWSVDGLSIVQLEQDAKDRVRKVKPDLVILSPPRTAAAASWDEFAKSFAWVMNWSLSFGRQEWDVVVVHPEVSEPLDTPGEFDDLIRQLVDAQDLTLIDRPNGNTGDGKAVFDSWLQREWKFAPAP